MKRFGNPPLSKMTPSFQLTPLFPSNFSMTPLFVQISKTRGGRKLWKDIFVCNLILFLHFSMTSLVWYFVRKGLKILPTKLKNLNLATANLSLTASWIFKKLLEAGCLLFANFSQCLTILIMLCHISINRSATTVSSTHRVAQKNKGNICSPVI